jgi:hypothetical protein
MSRNENFIMTALVVVKRNSLIGYLSDRDTPLSVVMPQSAMGVMEIADEKECAVLIEKTFGAKSTHPSIPTILVLSDELCFSEVSTPKDEEQAIVKLSGVVPFARISTTRLHTPDKSIIIAANEDLYEIIARLLGERGYPVTLVVPWAALVQVGISAHGEIDKITVRRVFDAQSQLRSMSFPCEVALAMNTPSAVPVSTQAPAKKVSKGLIIFGVLALIYAAFMFWYMMRR